MKKYVAKATVLGLRPGETFESDDEFYANIAQSGVIKEVSDDGGSTPGDQLGSVAEGAGDGVGEGDDGGGTPGGGKSKGTLPQ